MAGEVLQIVVKSNFGYGIRKNSIGMYSSNLMEEEIISESLLTDVFWTNEMFNFS